MTIVKINNQYRFPLSAKLPSYQWPKTRFAIQSQLGEGPSSPQRESPPDTQSTTARPITPRSSPD